MKTKILTFFFFIALISCDLLNAPQQNDYFRKIDDEIAWANAKKLTVHISYDPLWGASNPGRGQITPDRDIRQGYEFNIEFTPDSAYTLTEWRAFSGELPAGWSEDLNQFEIDMEGRELEAGKDFVLMSALSPRGGNNALKINTTGTITLVPWCRTEPRITRTEPRIPVSATVPEFSRGMVLTIFFNAPLNESSVYESLAIWNITDDEDYSVRYTVEYFEAAGQFVVTLTPKPDNLPEINKTIRVTLKSGENGIANIQGEWMSGSDAVYSWKTLNMSAGNVTEWGAAYNNSDNTITVLPWTVTGDYSRVEVSYTVNRGVRIPIEGSSSSGGTIAGVGRINEGNVRQGISVSGVQEYEIIFDIYVGTLIENSRSFKIWNIPGMSVSQGNPIIEILDASSGYAETSRGISIGLGSIPSGSTAQYVLGNSLEVSSHIPFADFKGTFYGNGHRLTINSYNTSYTGNYYGMFGSVSNAEIRDLTVQYSANVSTGANATHIGGLAGRVDGNTKITNTIVSGTGISVSSSSDVYAGSMLGYMESTSQIENCYTNIKLNAVGTGNGFIRAGGIAGFIANNSTVTEYDLMINKVTAAGIVDAKNTYNDSGNVGFIFIGGITGESQGFGTIQDVNVSATVRMWASNNSTDNRLAYICGGIIGRMREGHLLDCDFIGTIDIPENYKVLSYTWIGGVVGIAGYVYDNDVDVAGNNNEKQILVESSTTSGDISVKVTGSGHISLGGVCAAPYSYGPLITFKDCEYRNGSIRVERQSTGNINIDQCIGGFAGQIVTGVNFINCKSRARLVEIISRCDTTGGTDIKVGGFIGLARDTIEGCYSDSPVEVSIINESGTGSRINLNVGGFVGLYQIGTAWAPDKWISRSYSTGSVTATVYVANPVSLSTPSQLCIGGFGGRIQNQVWLEDCYATGNVSLDSKSTSSSGTTINYDKIYAGGFAGSVELTDDNYWLERCFSTGLVSTQGAASSRTSLYAGGFAGNLSSGLIRNCVALGSTVTAKGASTINLDAGRICGNDATSPTGLDNNFASALMVLEEGTYGSFNPSGVPVAGDGVANDENGLSIADSSFYDQNFWINTSSGPGFNSDIDKPWSFTGITSRGYPVLLDVGGQ